MYIKPSHFLIGLLDGLLAIAIVVTKGYAKGYVYVFEQKSYVYVFEQLLRLWLYLLLMEQLLNILLVGNC